MYLITNKNNVLIYIANLAVQNNKSIFISDEKLYITEPGVNLYEQKKIPKDITPYKYCYSDKVGFYKNPDYKVSNGN